MTLVELDNYCKKYISDFLRGQVGELTKLKKTVLHSSSNSTTLSDKIDIEESAKLTCGQKIAD